MKYLLESTFIINPLEEHKQIKDEVLKLIDEQELFENLYDPNDGVNITKCDWGTSRWDRNRKWVNTLMKDLGPHLQNTIKEMGYVEFTLQEMWYQQYEKASGHGWHVHGQNWTNVYFLELPEGSPKTQFINPFDQTTISEFNVKEGDVLTFPSYVIHRAPINRGDERKTIISWNMDTELKPGAYDNERH